MRIGTRRLAWIGAGAAATSALVVGYFAGNWLRYGRLNAALPPDPMLDRFMPAYEVREQHETEVMAPAALTYRAAREMNVLRSPAVRAIFRGRELLMHAQPVDAPPADAPLVEQTVALGWSILAEEPGHEIALGAMTRPWEANPRFETIPPAEFAAFTAPASVKIVWSLSVESLGQDRSIFRTETRVMTTDAEARRRFRRYWSVLSPGVLLIRRESLRLVRQEAERAYLAGQEGMQAAR